MKHLKLLETVRLDENFKVLSNEKCSNDMLNKDGYSCNYDECVEVGQCIRQEKYHQAKEYYKLVMCAEYMKRIVTAERSIYEDIFHEYVDYISRSFKDIPQSELEKMVFVVSGELVVTIEYGNFCRATQTFYNSLEHFIMNGGTIYLLKELIKP